MFTTRNLPTNYYNTLHLPTTATDEDIRKSYKDLAKILHPDKRPNNPKATSEFQHLQEAYSTLSDTVKRSQYDACLRSSSYSSYQPHHTTEQTHTSNHSSTTFNPEYQYAKFQDPRRFRTHSPPPKKPTPSPAEIFLAKRREKEHRRQLRRDTEAWEKCAREFAEGEKEKVRRRVEREGPVPEWLENLVEGEGCVDGKEHVVMDGEMLIDIDEDLIKFGDKIVVEEIPRPVFLDGMGWSNSSEGATPRSFKFETAKAGRNEDLGGHNYTNRFHGFPPFDPAEWKESEFGRPGERLRRRGSLGSHGRKASEEARRANKLPPRYEPPASRENWVPANGANGDLASDWDKGKSEWDIFFDRFEDELGI
ncbi:hypothetical protein EG328_008877 [Venturia inaequalis]|uniref:J domain-containing protein n=1 Tax=Venturia inaequalis TaxID=5025 RepID=A0A8H3YQI9_VENIN|nr:hypothetical protein EG328_008877 [Venturia inaequalis]